MSNHYSAANLKFPGDDPRLDFTDLFIFTSPNDPDKTVLIALACSSAFGRPAEWERYRKLHDDVLH
jgi:hypothetical protein